MFKFFQDREDEKLAHDKARLAVAISELRKIPTGRMLLAITETKRFFIRFNPDLRGDAYAVFRPAVFIDLSRHCPDNMVASALAHELRHAWQFERGICPRKSLTLDKTIRLRRIEEADAYSMEAQVAWELTDAKIVPDAWKIFRKKNKDLANAFEQETRKNPAAPQTGEAAGAVFRAWFDNRTIMNNYDRDTVAQVKDRHDKRASFAREFEKPCPAPPLSEAHLQMFGTFRDGINYLAKVKPVDKKRVNYNPRP